jgi:hypothetical protein
MTQTAEQYGEEQEKLRRKSEGEDDPDDLRTVIPQAPEVNPEVYKDVTSVLFRGFLTSTAEINDVLFVFKSLNQHEFELTRLMGGFANEGRVTSRFWDLFLAFGVFMVDGQNVLVDRQRWMPKIANMFRDMQPTARAKVIRHLSELNRRASNATVLVEAYAMENYSRYRWAQLHGLDLSLAAVTGIAGTADLGLNWAQLTWRAINYFEDTSAAAEREWENAKFVGSCMAGKGIQKIYNRDHDRHRKEMQDKIARKDRLLRHVYEGISLDEGPTLRDGQVVLLAQTTEQLADQVAKSLKGEKDWHDEVVDAHEQRIKDRVAAQREQLVAAAKASEESFRGQTIYGGSDTIGLTRAQVQERIARQKQIEAQRVSQGFVQPTPEESEKMERFMDRWGIAPGVSTTVGTSDKDPETAIPLPPVKTPGKPWRQ